VDGNSNYVTSVFITNQAELLNVSAASLTVDQQLFIEAMHNEQYCKFR
jgi:hypothetical protein